jgi:hypothetical protein
MSQLTEFSECIFEALPVDMMLSIIKHLRLKDIDKLYRVCKYTHELIRDNETEIRSKKGHLVSHPNGTFERVFEKDPNFKQKISFHEGNQTSYMDKPSVIEYYDGKITSKKWYFKSNFHRTTKDENGFTFPAIISYHDEKITSQAWYFDGRLNRIDIDENGVLPALICYGENGENEKMFWMRKGKAHRLECSKNGLLLPSEIVYRNDERFVKFHIFGNLFKEDFPLVIERAFHRHLKNQQ